MNTTLRHIVPTLLAPLLRLLSASLRMELRLPREGLPETRHGVVFAFWHGKMVTGWLLAQRLFPKNHTAAVVSLSKDGQLLSDTLGRLGFRLIRGSSSRGKVEVREGIADGLRSGGVVAVTPDGPRGPIHRFKYGTVRIASEVGSPLLFADILHQRPRVLKSWDRFELPRPFSKVTVTLHVVEVPRFTSEDELQRFANSLSERFAHA